MSEKSQAALSKALSNWFTAQFIKSIKLQQLRAVHQAGAYPAFAELLNEAPDADRITLLKKVDPYRPDMLMRSRAEVMTHIGGLASGAIEAAPKPAGKKAPAKKSSKGKRQVGIISTSKY